MMFKPCGTSAVLTGGFFVESRRGHTSSLRDWSSDVCSSDLRIEGDLEPSGEGLYDRMNGVGAHEVVIETPDHYASLATMSIDAVADVFLTFRDRILDLKKDPRFEYVLVFKNHGEAAGASLEHPHSQLIATPIIPIMVTEELAGSQQYWQRKERCVWCDVIRQDRRDRRRVVAETGGFVALEPFAPPFNFMLHTAPLRDGAVDYFHWHLEIIPKLTRVAGYEWGSGFFINPAPPEDAADALRSAAP